MLRKAVRGSGPGKMNTDRVKWKKMVKQKMTNEFKTEMVEEETDGFESMVDCR